MNILCTRRPDYENAKQSAIEHIQKTFLSFRRFATNKEAEYLGNVFLKSLDNLYQPTGKYYIDFLTNNNTVNDNQAGRKFYNDLPEGAYFAIGLNGSNPGDAFLFCFDSGTCLLPIYDLTGTQVCIPDNAGLHINNGKLEKA